MIIPALLLAATASQPNAQEGGSPRRGHPSDALFFVEVPDLHGLLEAYSRAPLVQMIADADVRTTVDSVLGGAGLDLGPQVTAALEAMGLPPDLARAPLAAARSMLDQVASASFSISVAGEPDSVKDALEKTVVSLFELKDLASKVQEYTEHNDGFPPGSLEEVELPEDLQRDGWGRPYEIVVELETLGYEVVSLGADGQRGGEGYGADLGAGEAGDAVAERLLAHSVNVLCEVDFRDVDQVQAGVGHVRELVGKVGWLADQPRSIQVAGGEARVSTFSDSVRAGRKVWLVELGQSLVLGYGAGSLEKFLERQTAETAGPSRGSPIGSLAAHLSEDRGATVARGWIQMGPLMGLLQGVKSAVESSGQGKVDYLPLPESSVFRMQLDGDRFVTELASITVGRTEGGSEQKILESIGCLPVPASMWDFVPAEAIGVYATSIDAPRAYREIMKSVGAGDEQKPRRLDELEKRHGFDLERDVFGSLGTGAAAYLLPITGVITVPGIAVVVELKDAQAFQRGLGGLLALLEEQAGGEFSVRGKPYRDQPMWSFSFGGGPEEGAAFVSPIAISPTLAIVRDHLLITLTSTRAKKEIKRLLEGEHEEHPVLALANRPPEDATSIGYMDWPAFVDGAYEGARAAISLFAGMSQDLPFDPGLLPDAGTFTRFYRPTVMWTRTEEGGISHLRLESSFGPETWLGVMGGGAALALGLRRRAAAPGADAHESAELEAAGTSEEDPERAAVLVQSRARLGELATRLEVYRIETGRYPVGVEVLLKPTPSYPRGYLPQGVVPVDGWGRDYVYLPASDGMSFSLWSVGENGIDERGLGDDVGLE